MERVAEQQRVRQDFDLRLRCNEDFLAHAEPLLFAMSTLGGDGPRLESALVAEVVSSVGRMAMVCHAADRTDEAAGAEFGDAFESLIRSAIGTADEQRAALTWISAAITTYIKPDFQTVDTLFEDEG